MSVDLVPEWTIGGLRLTSYPFGVDADSTVDIGEPDMVVESVTSMLADGDIERVVRHGNRTYVLDLYIEGVTLGDLAASEALLRSELQRTGLLLTHDAGDGFTPTSAYEVQTAQLTPRRRDDHESHLIRKFTLTLTCAPFARSADLVTVAAITPPASADTPTTATINNAETTSGWSAVVGTFSSYRGFIDEPVGVVDVGDGVSVTAQGSRLSMTCDLGAPVSISATPYLVVEMLGNAPNDYFRFGTVNGVHNLPVAAAYITPAGTTRFYFDVGSRSVAVTSISLGWWGDPYAPQSWSATVYHIGATDTLPFVTSHQASRIIEGKGTERTPASIQVSPGGSGSSLGWTIVHTAPAGLAGNSPALRQYRVSGNSRLADAGFMSGEAEVVTASPIVAQVPLTSLPEGEYSLVALMRSSVAGTFPIFWDARTLLPGIGYLGGTGGTSSATFEAANTWTLVPIDVVTLPPVRANGAFVQLNLSRSTTGESIEVDEWWALRMGNDCATTILCDNAAFLWLDSPDVTSAVPRIWVGGNGDRSDAHHPNFNLFAQGSHVLHPGGTAIFVATSGLNHPEVSATFYPRWHSNAAEVS